MAPPTAVGVEATVSSDCPFPVSVTVVWLLSPRSLEQGGGGGARGVSGRAASPIVRNRMKRRIWKTWDCTVSEAYVGA